MATVIRIRVTETSKRAAQCSGPLFDTLVRAWPREEMLEALSLGYSEAATRLLDLLLDPRQSAKPLDALAEMAGINFGELLDIFKRYKVDLGMVEIYARFPEVCKDMAEDALSRERACLACAGAGFKTTKMGEKRLCPSCRGFGDIRERGDPTSRKLIFAAAGLFRSASVNVRVHSFQGSIVRSVEDDLLDTRKLAKGKPEPDRKPN